MSAKNTIYSGIIALSAGLLLAACGGRAAMPVAEVSSLDSKLSCSHMSGEYENHDKRLVELLGEKKDRGRDNFGMLIASPLFLDMSDTTKNETLAIYDRQDRLIVLMEEKNCVLSASAQDRAKLAAQENAENQSSGE